MKNFILLIIFFVAQEALAMSDIIVVLNEGKIGDQNQLYGIVESIKSKSFRLSIEYVPSK